MNISLTLLLLLSFIAPVAAGPVGAAGPLWRSPECVDCPKVTFEIGDRSLALDAAGQPHVVYAGDRLTYAWFDGMEWRRETIDAAPGSDDVYPSPPSLALDAGGAPHVSYLSASSTALRYARRTAQGWLLETVDTAPSGQVFNYDTALALDRAGLPHIACFKNGQLTYAAWTGSRWRIQLVDFTQKAEFHVSLALDTADRPHISYGVWRGAAGLYLKYAHQVGGAWVNEIVEDGFLGEHNAIALDSQGVPYISYLDYAHSQLKVAHRTAAGWQIEAVDGVQWFGGFTSLALDGADRPHITYAGPPVGVRYARWTGATWQLETVGNAGWFTSLALDPAGQPRMVYFDTANRSLAYGRRTGGGWSWQAVDRLADVGSFNSLALDAAGVPAVAYYEAGHGDLRLAHDAGNGWRVETVDRIDVDAAGDGVVDDDVGRYASLAFGPAGTAWISYYDATHGDLKAAHRGPAGWVSEIVDAGSVEGVGDVGQYGSLALDAAGMPVISYYDATHGDLKVARQVAGGWQVETVDGVDAAIDSDVGRYTAIALDGDRPWVSYYDATNGDLKVARQQEDGKWLIETADSVDDVGAYTSLVLDAAGIPDVSYYDATHGDLKYAVRSAGGWRSETVDAVGAVGTHTSLALDARGWPSIAYTAANDGELRYAWRAGGRWTTRTLRQGWQVAASPSLAFTAQGSPRISFYDPGWRHLRLLRGAPFGAYLPLVTRE